MKWSGRVVIKVATDLQLNPAVSGAVSPRPHMPSWRANGRIGLYFTFNGMEQSLKNLSQVNVDTNQLFCYHLSFNDTATTWTDAAQNTERCLALLKAAMNI
jgi:hypothetical protein